MKIKNISLIKNIGIIILVVSCMTFFRACTSYEMIKPIRSEQCQQVNTSDWGNQYIKQITREYMYFMIGSSLAFSGTKV